MTTLKTLLAGTAFATCAAGHASAAVLGEVSAGDLASSDKLFTTEWKRDRNVDNGGQRGDDIFLRNNESFATPSSFNVSWTGSSYDWSLSYSGGEATLVFGGVSNTIDVEPDGDWNAIEFFIRASDTTRFDTSTATVSIDAVNGTASGGFTQSATDGTFSGIFALAGFDSISSLSGTMSFEFDVASGAGGSPNGLLAINVKALEVAAVPVPPAIALGLLGLGGLVLCARHQRRATKD